MGDGVQLTWLDGNRYYTMTAAGAPATEVIFGRTGANDPNFNLTVEPLVLLRRNAGSHLFASVIEPHGYFNEAQERSEQARPRIQSIRVLQHNADGSAVEVTGEGGLKWLVLVSNKRAGPAGRHQLTVGGQTYEWNGNYEVRGVQGVNN